MSLQPPKRYSATVKDVTEIGLTGSAAPAPWIELLQAEGLEPRIDNGRVEVTLLGCKSKYMGIAFREVSVSVRLAEDDAYFLLAARNSARFFAWVERTIFGTPYLHGNVSVDATQCSAADKDGVIVSAAVGDAAREKTAGDTGWEGPLFVPGGKKVFFAKLVGARTEFPFTEGDTFSVAPRGEDDPFGILILSGFKPATWHVRTGAVHSRSKSMRR